ncbi:MAG: PKD domain-containing protein, partial [Sulfurifustaceae bacterium]
AYVRSLDIGAELNGLAIGPDFVMNGPEATYSPPTRLPEGSNRLNARATDLFGHASEEASSKFTIDTIPPKFISVAPADGTTVNKGTVVISGSIDDPTANVILGDGNGQGISMTSGVNFSFAVVLKTGLNRFVLMARDPAGNESSVPLRINYNPVSVKITSPMMGTALTARGAVISGNFEGPLNTGVTVNGTPAEIAGGRFYVNLSLQSGSNTLTAVATTPDGATASDTVTVTVNAPSVEPVSIAVEPQSGVAPLTVRFTITGNSAQPVASLSVDFDGDGSSDVSLSNPTQPLEHVYTVPGVYQTRVIAVDGAGAASTQTIAIVVSDGRQMDQLFTALWSGMNDALVHGDIATAVSFLNASAKRKYQPVFEALKPNFPQIVASYSPLRRVSISADIGEYAIVRSFNGENRLYLIYFLRDADGVWRVDAM